MTITDAPTTTTNPWSWTTPQTPTTDAPTVAQVKPATSANATLRALAMKEIMSGILWIVAGVAITVGTMSMHLPVFFIAFGPVIFGAKRVRRGFKLLAQA
jgi:hypothetical protein